MCAMSGNNFHYTGSNLILPESSIAYVLKFGENSNSTLHTLTVSALSGSITVQMFRNPTLVEENLILQNHLVTNSNTSAQGSIFPESDLFLSLDPSNDILNSGEERTTEVPISFTRVLGQMVEFNNLKLLSDGEEYWDNGDILLVLFKNTSDVAQGATTLNLSWSKKSWTTTE